MITLNNTDIAEMEKFYRINLINGLAGFKPLHLLGTSGGSGISNLCLVSSVFHLGAHPPLLGLVIRPERAHNDTLRNIRATGQFTLNNVLPDWYRQAHQTSASYASGISEFEACGFCETYLPEFKAPFVAESTIQIGLALREILPVGLNNTTIVIGEVMYVRVKAELIAADGTIDHVQAGTMSVAGLDSYFLPRFVGRLSYAKPGFIPKQIDTNPQSHDE